jgi:RNA polymerase sigma factor (sigma-70 family)
VSTAPRPEDHLGLVFAAVRRYRSRAAARGIDPGDLIGEGFLALVKATRAFDPARGVKFSSFAFAGVRMAVAKMLRVRRYRPLRPLSVYGDGEAVEVADGRPGADPGVTEEVGRLLRWLSPRERAVVESYFGLRGGGRSVAELAREYGVSRQRVAQVLTGALTKMRRRGG